MHTLPARLSAGLEAWVDAVREMAQAPEFRCVLPAPDPETGFNIAIERSAGRVTANFGGLIHDCDDGLDEALWWAQRAYSPGWQLRIDSVGGRATTFTLENPAEPEAGCLSSAYVVLFSRWRRRSTAHRSNAPAVADELALQIAGRSVADDTQVPVQAALSRGA